MWGFVARRGTEKRLGVVRWEFELAKTVHFDAFGCIGSGVGWGLTKEDAGGELGSFCAGACEVAGSGGLWQVWAGEDGL
jgi:hypothetical protein